jgi:hypothetical protein
MSELNRLDGQSPQNQFKRKALTALGVSIIADVLDYVAAPIFAVPVVGDIFDVITIALLYNITKSKFATTLNMIEFVPVIGDLLPVYTLATVSWIIKESASIYVKGPIQKFQGPLNQVTSPIRAFANRFQHR